MKIFLLILCGSFAVTYSYPDYCSTEKFNPWGIKNWFYGQDCRANVCGFIFYNYLNHPRENYNLGSAAPKRISKRQSSYRDPRLFGIFLTPFLSNINRQFSINQSPQFSYRQPQQNNQRQTIQFSNRFSNNQQPQHGYGQQYNTPHYSNTPSQFSISFSRPQQYSSIPQNSYPQQYFNPQPQQSSVGFSKPVVPIIINLPLVPRDPDWERKRDEEIAQSAVDRKRDRYPNWQKDVENQHKIDVRNGVNRILDINKYINSLPKNSVLYETLTSFQKAEYYKGIPICEYHLLAPIMLYQLSLGERKDVKSFRRPDGTTAKFEFNHSCPHYDCDGKTD